MGLLTYPWRKAYLKYCLRADSLSAIVTGARPIIVSVKRDIKSAVYVEDLSITRREDNCKI